MHIRQLTAILNLPGSSLSDITNLDHQPRGISQLPTCSFTQQLAIPTGCSNNPVASNLHLEIQPSLPPPMTELYCKEYEQRCGRFTASSFHDILVRKTSSDPNVLVKRLVTKKDLSHIPAIHWGIEHQDEAREGYISKAMSSDDDLQYTQVGLVVNPQ